MLIYVKMWIIRVYLIIVFIRNIINFNLCILYINNASAFFIIVFSRMPIIIKTYCRCTVYYNDIFIRVFTRPWIQGYKVQGYKVTRYL